MVQTLVLTLPAESVRSNISIVAAPSFVIAPAPAAVALHAAALDGADELALGAGGARPTITLNLTGDVWSPTVGNASEPAATAAILAGLFSLQAEPGGWNAIVAPQLTPETLVRLSDTVVVVTVPRVVGYDIDA